MAPQGLAAAAATREAAKRKREQDGGAGPAAKAPRRVARPIPVISHEVAVPKGYDAAARKLDPETYGARHMRPSSGPHHTAASAELRGGKVGVGYGDACQQVGGVASSPARLAPPALYKRMHAGLCRHQGVCRVSLHLVLAFRLLTAACACSARDAGEPQVGGSPGQELPLHPGPLPAGLHRLPGAPYPPHAQPALLLHNLTRCRTPIVSAGGRAAAHAWSCLSVRTCC